jgi:hypothetical protein
MPYEFLFLLFGLSVLLFSFLTFDKIVRLEYEGHRSTWENDGKPKGFFWRAPECNWFGSELARAVLSLKWVFSTPAWAERSERCPALFNRLRLYVLAWNVWILILALMLPFGGQTGIDLVFSKLVR